MTQLHQVAQHAEDLDRAADFYATVLGGTMIAMFDPPGLAFIDLGGVRLLLERAAPSALIYLRVPDVRATISRLRDDGVTVHTEPHRIHVDADGAFGEPGGEEWMAFIRGLIAAARTTAVRPAAPARAGAPAGGTGQGEIRAREARWRA